MNRLVKWLVENRLVALIVAVLLVGLGLSFSPFSQSFGIPRDPIAVDAIPDIGENQQIVFTKWTGRSPTDIDDQITYPLTTALLGVPGVKTIRSSSMFGFSSIYVIFEDDVAFYWARTRLLEKLNALAPGTLPNGVTPTLGPDATALGQVFWYTLEARDPDGKPASAWDLHELRTIQDYTVRNALLSATGVAEVASIGGYQSEYQIDIRPEALEAFNLSLIDVAKSVKGANLDVGARTMEINGAEYVVRGIGSLDSEEDLRNVVVAFRNDRPVRLRDIAHVVLGPAIRRGVLDYGGAETVGGIVVARFGANPVEVIDGVKERIKGLSLPTRSVNGVLAQLTVVPVYDRSILIEETITTLSDALLQQILITILVVLFLLGQIRSSLVISITLPVGVLLAFIAMKIFGVTANIMSLAGIAIAIGAMVDVGIVLTENVVRHLREAPPDEDKLKTIASAVTEIAPAITTSVATTVISFIPVFALTASEGKLFTPLALTKTFAMIGALLVAFAILPPLIFTFLPKNEKTLDPRLKWGTIGAIGLVILGLLTDQWMPLGYGNSFFVNALFVVVMAASVLGTFALFERYYPALLAWTLENKTTFIGIPTAIFTFGLFAWIGAPALLDWLPTSTKQLAPVSRVLHAFPGLEDEFMPPFDEGAYLYMPSTMHHASIGTAKDQLREIDAMIARIPEVEDVVGKLGRADTSLDPAPVSMFETLVTYKPEWSVVDGERVRNWRPHIQNVGDIWDEIVAAAEYPGVTSAPKLMPINTRIVMLQSGMRAPLGIKVRGPTLDAVERGGFLLEAALKQVPAIKETTVFAERVVGKPYLEIEIDRDAIARHGLSITTVQQTIQIAIGGARLTQTIEGRERFNVSLRYIRDARQGVDALKNLTIMGPGKKRVPLAELAQIHYVRGPQVIKSEDTFLVSAVTFDKIDDISEVAVVEQAEAFLDTLKSKGALQMPEGVSYEFAGTYENQVRSEKRLKYLVPIAIVLIFLLLYIQFGTISRSIMVFTSVAVAISGGFIFLWLYNQPWFLNFDIAGLSVRSLFHVNPTNLSVAIWVGFIALIGIATDDGVVMATYLKQRFQLLKERPTVQEIREAVIDAGSRRIRACLMTTATTLLALLPVLTASGRGSDVMAPMALPIFGGMMFELVTLFVVPVLWSAAEEFKLWAANR